MFIDEATIRARGGHGGSGVIHFYSSRHNPRGGPDGGSGAHGGSVVLRTSGSLSTLFPFRNRPRFDAGNGVNGGRNNCTGARGEDRIVLVPVGTVVREAETGNVLADLARDGDELAIAQGGEGGRGNASFVTPTRQGPRICERGLAGEDKILHLELKLIADVAIIGYPNVGKSSLISSISAKRAKVADYPFTTIVPNLGVVDVDGIHQFVAVDVPGLIEGAHEGKGLGDRFLRHIERTRVFLHIVDLTPLEGRDPTADYRRINEELSAFDASLAQRKQIVVGNKIDLLDDSSVEEVCQAFAEIGAEILPISVATMRGVRDLVLRTYRTLKEERERCISAPSPVQRRVYRYRGEAGFRVEREGEGYVVVGEAVERMVKKLVLDSRDAREYLRDRLEKMGVFRELRRLGYEDGQTFRIGEVEIESAG